ncbi:hypothetical protein [Nitrolancea hollandica]|uniref:Uncharacterized protein n=1 Tax=Nitrolancea hollandica Lb TaxID=1129897 RepID=I4EKF0_9BACT|nr:hypothetical protein [Nitrolancea hollandica]CCF85162.1 hypothetical protein NITHO_4590001 [Nitrolancea hollandica Lb]
MEEAGNALNRLLEAKTKDSGGTVIDVASRKDRSLRANRPSRRSKGSVFQQPLGRRMLAGIFSLRFAD